MAEARVHVHHMDREGAFRQDDRLILTSPKRFEKIRHALTKLPVPIIVHFVNTNQITDLYEHFRNRGTCIGELTRKQIQRQYDVDIPETSDVLTVLLVENEGQKRLPLTPWMVLHRLSHVFFQNISETKDPDLYSVWKDFQSASQAIAICYTILVLDEVDCLTRTGFDVNALPSIYGTTAACRADNLFQFGEWLHECFAQRYMTGRISFNPVQDSFQYKSFRYAIKIDRTRKEIQEKLDFLSVRLIKAFDGMLLSAVGSIRVL